MWRRIPILPMLIGVFAAWALLAMIASRERSLSTGRIYVTTGALAAAYALVVYAVFRLVPQPKSRAGSIGYGCAFAWIGIFFVVVVAVFPVLLTGRGITIYGIAPAVMTIAAFSGLGVIGGLMWDRFRRAEVERQQAALAAQAAAFAREQLELARDLQQRLLPPPELKIAGCRVTARNVPAAYVAGDFYDFIPIGNDRLLLVLADVAGKGVSAGLIMATVKGMIPFLASEPAVAASLLGRLNEQMSGRLSRHEFVAMIVALYMPGDRSLSIANAGLPDPLLIGPDGAARPVTVLGPRYPVGIRKSMSYESVTVKLAPGDRLFFFTDGVPEAPLHGEPIGYERLSAEVGRCRGEIDALFASLEKTGAAHDDDWTAILLEALGPSS